MSATDAVRRSPGSRKRGVSLVASLGLVLIVAGFSVTMVRSTNARQASVRNRVDTSRAFHIAEGGLDYCASKFTLDRIWAARNTADFPTVLADGTFESRWMTFGGGSGSFRARVAFQTLNSLPSTWTGTGFPDGWAPATTITFPDRDPATIPPYDRVVVEVLGRAGGESRTVRGELKYTFGAYGAAIVSDALQGSGNGSGKSWSISNKTVVFTGDQQYVTGGMQANGGIYLGGASTPLTDDNVSTQLSGFTGSVRSNLGGTSEEIPDYTSEGATEQLFDFGRFEAAARAGYGARYTSLASFASAMRAANAAGRALEGIIFVRVDCAAEGGSPKLNTGTGDLGIPGGINVKGTLVFSFVNAPDRFYKIFIETPLRINAAPLPANYSPTDPSTHLSAYPPVIAAAVDPRGKDLSAYGYEGFQPGDDLPALMFETGTVDIHHEANVCGAVYGPSFIEIENNNGKRQYFNGIVIGGAGIFLKGSSTAGAVQHFIFSQDTIDSLATFDDSGKTPSITRFSVAR